MAEEVTNESFQELIAVTREASGLSSRRVELAIELTDKIDAQTAAQVERAKILEAQGISIKDNAEYQKEEMNIAKLELNRARITGSAEAEDAAKAKLAGDKDRSFLKSIATGITGIAKQGMQKVKSGLGGLSKFLMGGLAVAALAFLNNPKFEEIKNQIIDVIVPKLAVFYDKVLVPVGEALVKLFSDLMGYLSGEKSLMSVLKENKLAIAGIVTALAPGLVFGGLKSAVLGIGKALLWASAKTGLTALITTQLVAIKASFVALKTSLTTAVWPAITAKLAAIKGFFAAKLVALKALLVPMLPVIAIAAAIGVVLYSLKQAFDDFMFELEATGSIWEATKTGIVSVISNILGLPFDLIKDGVSWIIGKIGSVFGLESFKNASKVMDEFSLVDTIAEGLTFMGDAISGVFDTIVNKIQNIIRSISIPGLFDGDNLADTLFGTTEEQEAAKKEKAEEQKLFEENRKALREQQKLEKEAAEAEKLKKIKEQQAVPKVPIFERLGNPRGVQAPTQNTIINAPNNVNAPTTTTLTTASTSIINTDRVTDKLSIVS